MATNQESQNQGVVYMDNKSRVRGRDAQRINILVAKAVANAVKSTLGPKGMDKMLVDDLGDITISNDGATILSEMSIDHPAGKMMVEVAKTQDDMIGDGTTSAVILAGGLLGKAENLLDDEIHPSIIIKGYRQAAKKAKEFYEQIADPITIKDTAILRDIAMTSMTGKSAESEIELANLVMKAVTQVMEEENSKVLVDIEHIKIEKKVGGSLDQSELVSGIVIDKEIVHPNMPKKVANAKIALVDCALEIKDMENDAKIEITSPDQLQAFMDQEEAMLRKMVSKIKESGATVVISQKGIDDTVQHFLAKEKIAAVRRVKKSDMDALARATGGKIITLLDDLSKDDLGFAQTVSEKKVSGDQMVFVEGCKNPKSVSILLRGGSEHVVDEAERAIKDAIGATTSAIKAGKIVTGGGSSEVEVAMRLREFAKTVGGREQLAIEAFAETLEIIPRTLAETAGMDPIDTIVALRSKHSSKDKDAKYIGVDVYNNGYINMLTAKVIEPVTIKTQAIACASEVAEMLLRIDDIIAATGSKTKGMPPGGMGGMDMDM